MEGRRGEVGYEIVVECAVEVCIVPEGLDC